MIRMTTTATVFDFERPEDGTLPLEAAVYQALTAAVSRSESDRIGDIGDRLVEFIREDDVPELLAEVGRLRAAASERAERIAAAYTPPTVLVRDGYVRGMRQAFVASSGEHGDEFDRWLQRVAREAAARALDDAAVIARQVRESEIELHQLPFDQIPRPNQYFAYGAVRAAENIEAAASALRAEGQQ